MLSYDNIEMIGDDIVRYVLKKEGKRTLIVIALNPSTADKVKSDRTVDKIRVYCELWGFDSFIFMNLYPVRSTKPTNLPLHIDLSIHKKNLQYITDVLLDNNYPVLFAFGDSIKERNYLNQCKKDVFELVSKLPHREFLHLGTLTKNGNPRHPSRLAYNIELNSFNIPTINETHI